MHNSTSGMHNINFNEYQNLPVDTDLSLYVQWCTFVEALLCNQASGWYRLFAHVQVAWYSASSWYRLFVHVRNINYLTTSNLTDVRK